MTNASALPLVALAFAAWAVFLGGLAALQHDCDTDSGGARLLFGVAGALPCSKVYRLHWFYMSWEFVVVAILAVASVTGRLKAMRSALVGLFSVATLLFIDASNTFLTAQSVDYFTEDQPLHIIRTVTAGAIMTALLNAIIVVAVGWECEGCSLCGASEPAAAPKAEAAAAAAAAV